MIQFDQIIKTLMQSLSTMWINKQQKLELNRMFLLQFELGGQHRLHINSYLCCVAI